MIGEGIKEEDFIHFRKSPALQSYLTIFIHICTDT